MFIFLTGLTAYERTGEEVLSFFVTLPFSNLIIKVDLLNNTVSQPIKPIRNVPVTRSVYKTLRPNFLTVVNNDLLLVTTDYNIFSVNLRTEAVELYTNPDRILAGDPVDGEFGRAQVGLPGPATPIPGHGGLFVVADTLHGNVRIIDMNRRRISSLCRSRFIESAQTTTISLTDDAYDKPTCEVDYPYGVAFMNDSLSRMVISHGYEITYFSLSCEYCVWGSNGTVDLGSGRFQDLRKNLSLLPYTLVDSA